MAYGRLISALNSWLAAKRVKADVNREYQIGIRNAKKEVDNAKKSIEAYKQKASYLKSIYMNDRSMAMQGQDAATQQNLFAKITEYNANYEAITKQYETLVNDVLHEKENAYDQISADLTMKKESAKEDEEIAKADYDEAKKEQDSTRKMMYNSNYG